MVLAQIWKRHRKQTGSRKKNALKDELPISRSVVPYVRPIREERPFWQGSSCPRRSCRRGHTPSRSYCRLWQTPLQDRVQTVPVRSTLDRAWLVMHLRTSCPERPQVCLYWNLETYISTRKRSFGTWDPFVGSSSQGTLWNLSLCLSPCLVSFSGILGGSLARCSCWFTHGGNI